MPNIKVSRVYLVQKDIKLKAVATITIDDCFAIHDIKIIEGEKGLFIAMPSRKLPNGSFKDVAHPLNTETREEIFNKLLVAYREEVENPHTDSSDAE